MTTDAERIKALEDNARMRMEIVSDTERDLQVAVEKAMAAIKLYHEALGLNPDETQLCIYDGCPNVGEYEQVNGEYVCQTHYVP